MYNEQFKTPVMPHPYTQLREQKDSHCSPIDLDPSSISWL